MRLHRNSEQHLPLPDEHFFAELVDGKQNSLSNKVKTSDW